MSTRATETSRTNRRGTELWYFLQQKAANEAPIEAPVSVPAGLDDLVYEYNRALGQATLAFNNIIMTGRRPVTLTSIYNDFVNGQEGVIMARDTLIHAIHALPQEQRSAAFNYIVKKIDATDDPELNVVLMSLER